ncbi:MAG: Crp/Fnr family transcriptional regulator, partial [Flavobacteriales bacterium]|nr:Crp/Fnr family transcriptional regulator [Flavobacteriales bacterium]
SERLRALEQRYDGLVFKDVRTRLLDFLRRYVELFGSERDAEGAVPNHLRQEDIAQLIGSTRQTVTATLRQLEREGLVCYSRQRIRLG